MVKQGMWKGGWGQGFVFQRTRRVALVISSAFDNWQKKRKKICSIKSLFTTLVRDSHTRKAGTDKVERARVVSHLRTTYLSLIQVLVQVQVTMYLKQNYLGKGGGKRFLFLDGLSYMILHCVLCMSVDMCWLYGIV